MTTLGVRRFLSARLRVSRTFSLNALITYAAHGVPLLAGFALMYLINTYSGVETYGRLAILVASTSLVGNVLGARTGAAVVKFYVREALTGEIGHAKRLVFVSLAIDLALGAVTFGVVSAVSGVVATRFLQDPELAGLVVIHSLIVVARHLRRSMLGYLEAHRLFILVNLSQVVEATMKVVLVAVLFLVLEDRRLHTVVVSYLVSATLGTLLVTGLFMARARKEFRDIRMLASRDLMAEYLRYNLKWFCSATVATGWEQAQQLILALFATPAVVGTYQILRNLLAPMHLIGAPFNLSTFPVMSRLYATQRIDELKRYMRRLTWVSVPLAALVGVSLNALIGPLVGVFGVAADSVIRISFGAISLRAGMRSYVWWGRNICSLVDPMIDLYRNVINALSFLVLATAALLFLADLYDSLLLISVTTLAANVPAYFYALRAYRSRL